MRKSNYKIFNELDSKTQAEAFAVFKAYKENNDFNANELSNKINKITNLTTSRITVIKLMKELGFESKDINEIKDFRSKRSIINNETIKKENLENLENKILSKHSKEDFIKKIVTTTNKINLTKEFDTTLYKLNSVIERWSLEINETNKSNNFEKIISLLENNSFDKQSLYHLYRKENLSYEEMCSYINKKAGSTIIRRKNLTEVLEYYSIPIKSKKEIDALRREKIAKTYSEKEYKTDEEKFPKLYSNKDEIIKMYNDGMSLTEIKSEKGYNTQILGNLLKKNGISIRHQMSKKELFKLLEEVGLTQGHLYNYYVTEGHTKKELINYIGEEIGYIPGSKSIQNIIEEYNLTKTPEQLKAAQATGPRKNREFSFKLLKKAGFNDGKELAEYYMGKPELTYKTLAEELNKKCGRENFTERWLVRYMTPHITEEFKQSQEEKKFVKFVKTLTNTKVMENDRRTIKPLELDIYLPELQLAIEFNGDYWHSDAFIIENKGISAEAFHAMKAGLCLSRGITLAFVWESDWVNNKTQVMEAVEKFIKTKELSPILQIFTKNLGPSNW